MLLFCAFFIGAITTVNLLTAHIGKVLFATAALIALVVYGQLNAAEALGYAAFTVIVMVLVFGVLGLFMGNSAIRRFIDRINKAN